MSLDELADITASWRKYPPLPILVASYLGVTEKREEAPMSIEDLVAVLGGEG